MRRHPLRDLSLNNMHRVGEPRGRTCPNVPLKPPRGRCATGPRRAAPPADEEHGECKAPRRREGSARIPSLILDDDAGDLVGQLKGMAVSVATPHTGSYAGAGSAQRRCGAGTPGGGTFAPFPTAHTLDVAGACRRHARAPPAAPANTRQLTSAPPHRGPPRSAPPHPAPPRPQEPVPAPGRDPADGPAPCRALDAAVRGRARGPVRAVAEPLPRPAPPRYPQRQPPAPEPVEREADPHGAHLLLRPVAGPRAERRPRVPHPAPLPLAQPAPPAPRAPRAGGGPGRALAARRPRVAPPGAPGRVGTGGLRGARGAPGPCRRPPPARPLRPAPRGGPVAPRLEAEQRRQ